MKYTNTLKGIVTLVMLTLGFNNAYTQCNTNCDIQCNSQINVSLDQNCMALITPSMGGVGVAFGDPCYSVQVFDDHDIPIVDNIVDLDYLDQNLTYKITEAECGNICWGKVKVQYKLAPQLECPPDLTIQCHAVGFLSTPPATGACATFEVSLFSEEKTKLSCDPLYTSIIKRTYKAVDVYGNEDTCSHKIYVERVDLGSIIFPGSTSISCSDPTMRFNEFGRPIPWYYQPLTGSGTAMGIPIICTSDPTVTGLVCPGTGSGTGIPVVPIGGGIIIQEVGDTLNPDIEVNMIPEGSGADVCSAIVTYTDLDIPSANQCRRKIIRTWEVREWWCSDEITNGTIQQIQIIDDKAPEFTCPADFTVSTDHNCASEILLPAVNPEDICGELTFVKIEYDLGFMESDGGLAKLKLGNNQVKYTVSDDCHNSSTCIVNVTVQDMTDPVAICEAGKVVSMSTADNTIVAAEVFDNGSFDECALDRMEVARMSSSCNPEDTLYSNYIKFCCEDVNAEETMVLFRVIDKAGNISGACMVSVEVQDKSVPSITCPDDVAIDCRVPYDSNNLNLAFGSPVIDATCGGNHLPQETMSDDMNQCGIGKMTRLFELFDQTGNVIRSCSQVVTITNETPFTAQQIQWPLDYEAVGVCDVTSLVPNNLPNLHSVPTYLFGNDQCTVLGFDYEDQIFTSNNSEECAVIQRTWTVVNWCSPVSGTFEKFINPEPQIIKLINNVAPVLGEGLDLRFETSGIDCSSTQVQYQRTATDDCLSELFWEYTIKQASTGSILQKEQSDFLTGKYPAGEYLIEWLVHDGCGNFDSDTQKMSIISTKAPTPVCLNGLSAMLEPTDTNNDGMADSETVELWASDFNAGSSHSCGNPITFSFSADTTDKVFIYDCDHRGRQTVEMWVTDQITGTQDFCRTFIDIQDEGGCPDFNMAIVEGDIYTELLDRIEGVSVNMDISSPSEITDDAGEYAFNMPIGGRYEVVAYFNDNYLNGVSTKDLILIQRHVLGTQKLDSPYKLIAADINKSGNINGLDLIELRKLVLGIYNEFPNNESWRFINADYSFPDPQNPWADRFPESYEIPVLDKDMNLDFIGVKIGDIDMSATANLSRGQSIVSQKKSLKINAAEKSSDDGSITIEVTAENYTDIHGLQATLELNSDEYLIKSVEGVSLKIDPSELNLTYSSRGILTISHISDQPETFTSEDVLFVITAESKTAARYTGLNVTSKMTTAEAYDDELNKVSIVQGVTESSAQPVIINVHPNPWIESATLKFAMPYDSNGVWEFYDINGKLIHSRSGNYISGEQTIELYKKDINANGMIYIKFKTGNHTINYKMLML